MFQEDVLDMLEASSLFVKQANEEINTYQSMHKRAMDKVETTADYLLKAELIKPTEKTAAEAMLADHATTLDLIRNMADRIQELQVAQTKLASEPGRPVSDESQTLSSTTSNYVGEKCPAGKKESDRIWDSYN